MFKCDNCLYTFSSAIKFQKHGRYPCTPKRYDALLNSSSAQEDVNIDNSEGLGVNKLNDVLNDLYESIPNADLQC